MARRRRHHPTTPPKSVTRPRTPTNQELRTRKDLLLAAARLTKAGRRPSMDEVAREAMVSRATAYRYFSDIEMLLAETPADAAMPNPDELFRNHPSTDPEERVDEAEACVHQVMYENEAQLRIMLAHQITHILSDNAVPSRQNRRGPLIEAALAPARRRFRDADYARLRIALAMFFGPESMIVARDVLRIDSATARRAKSWAVRALVRAAMQPAGPKAAR